MNSINQWTIQANKASGDCFFEALRDSLNGYNAKAYDKNKIIVAPYYNARTGLYTESSLRRAVADYIASAAGNQIYDNLVTATQAEINSLANPFDPIGNQFRFMVDDNNNILGKQRVSERISRSATASEREPGERVMKQEEYYWGDLTAASVSEEIFGIKIVLISTGGMGARGQNGTLVSFNDNKGNLIEGTIKNSNFTGRDPNKHVADVETNNYVTYTNVPLNILRPIPRYSIYCHDTDTDLRNVDKFIFMLYSNENHFEALYVEKARDNRKYLFNAADMPSYIKYMIFENCYRILPNDTFRDESSYGSIISLAGFLKDIQRLHLIKSSENDGSMAGQLLYSKARLLNGGQAGLQRYNVGYDPNLTYYIVIDLELYPGDHIPLETKASLACQIRYEKIRQSYADLFGLVYQPKELNLTEDLNKKYISKKNKTQKTGANDSRANNTTRRA
jgi:hypothetical protein